MALLVYCVTGNATLCIDTEGYSMGKGNGLFVLPYKMLRLRHATEDFRVTCFTFCREILDNVITGMPAAIVLYIRRHPLIALNGNDHAFIGTMARQLADVRSDGRQVYKNRIVSNIISNFLIIHYGPPAVTEEQREAAYNRGEELFKRFLTDMEVCYSREHSVGGYARMLCISAKYLTQITRIKTGKPPKELIDEVILRRALTLLKDSNKSVKEVSIECGFSNPAYFSRFIKRMTGITPQGFRKRC